MYFETVLPSPLGPLTLTGTETALTGLQLGGDPSRQREALPLFTAVECWLASYWTGRDPGPVPVSLSPTGTEFQRQVWDLLQKIPYGESRSYGQLAQMLARQRGIAAMSAQAVGQAVGKNPIAILIPCHRILGKSGRLTGYAWGLSIKRQLLDLEAIPYR